MLDLIDKSNKIELGIKDSIEKLLGNLPGVKAYRTCPGEGGELTDTYNEFFRNHFKGIEKKNILVTTNMARKKMIKSGHKITCVPCCDPFKGLCFAIATLKNSRYYHSTPRYKYIYKAVSDSAFEYLHESFKNTIADPDRLNLIDDMIKLRSAILHKASDAKDATYVTSHRMHVTSAISTQPICITDKDLVTKIIISIEGDTSIVDIPTSLRSAEILAPVCEGVTNNTINIKTASIQSYFIHRPSMELSNERDWTSGMIVQQKRRRNYEISNTIYSGEINKADVISLCVSYDNAGCAGDSTIIFNGKEISELDTYGKIFLQDYNKVFSGFISKTSLKKISDKYQHLYLINKSYEFLKQKYACLKFFRGDF